jgi:hypothetical protein
MTRRSDANNEWVICLFDFIGKDCRISAINPENHMALAVLCIIGFIAYWVPTLAANSNRHRNRTAIGMLNLFLGWTFIGWLVALLWADTDNCEP